MSSPRSPAGRRRPPARARDERPLPHSSGGLTGPADTLHALISHLPGLVYRCGVGGDGGLEFVSDGCTSLTGYRPADLMREGSAFRDRFLHPDDGRVVRSEIRSALDAKQSFQITYRIRTAKGAERWVTEQGRPVVTTGGAVIAVDGYINDVTERKLAEQSLAEHAIRDPLTGLYNRRFFDGRIGAELARIRRTRRCLAILLCDLDGFKAINDIHGHQVGDDVLRDSAQAIQTATRGTDLVVRWGGDEMVVLLGDSVEQGGLIAAQRIRDAIRAISAERGITLDVSIGVALCPLHGQDEDSLIRVADRALYIAKKSGDHIHCGEEHYPLDERAVDVVFQPIVDVWANQTMGYEALSRDPEGRLSITELFKKYHAVGQLDELKLICLHKQLRLASRAGLPRVFLNVDLHALERLGPLMKPPGLDVVFEISEREALHDVEANLAIASTWRSRGFKFAIDDFGAGFVSLPFVARLMPEYIKIDRSLVLQAVSSDTFKGFSKHLLLALRMYAAEGIIAEGIETDKELQVMKSIGIFLIQGFLLGAPQPIADGEGPPAPDG
ncbi:MAG: diguanylate cyclase [Nitrospiria bacterium]